MGRPMITIENGKRFGYLTFIEECGFDEDGKRWSLFRCDCGCEKKLRTNNVMSGQATSCGCKRGKKPKLTEEQRAEIIELSSKLTAVEIGSKFCRHPATIRSVLQAFRRPKETEESEHHVEENGFFDVDAFFRSDFILQA